MAEVSADINDFTRRMRLKEYFHDHNNSTQPNEHNPFHNKSSWTPPTDRDPALNTYVDAIKHDILTVNRNHITDNLTKDERQALRNLKKRQDIIIKPADKGSGTVVMDKSWYIDECNRQLNDAKFYRQLDGDVTDTIQQRVTVYIERMFNDGYIDENTKKYRVQTNVKPGRFYILPKIHKTGNPGRPIVSSNSHPTERISQFVDYHINPLVSTLDSHVKDTTDFLNKLSNLGNLPNSAILVTLDVSSLYNNILHNQGIDACRHFLDTRSNKHIPTETLCDLLHSSCMTP